MAHLYFTRHGKTVWNVENKICGATDSPLIELGHKQAIELGKKIAYDRAKKNRDRSFFKRANTYANFVATKQNQIFNLIDDYGTKLSVNQDYRAKKIGEQVQE